ncbi:NAD(P)-dependent dehydrogenase (short-subunit alcohol dehydrogenase family) [Streptomyces sp. 1114.5]|uniref:SDR family NAD(P)-dependent oxidoreductase n=1 Tax=Streptomyces sp. 1114.5 TaxID=1938830 RepID=UPI000EB2C69F|nr:glucose 1-dehydrogenase [Streptomyces sp. 1114.5]RKT19151.1 NAD(P)-dependent dehydrogenase (short-subunit alcohol dehydrogenase family) [Streptomyces sp. 1114.5]
MNTHHAPSSDRTVLITGGTSGMGLATAHRLLAAGTRVVITGRDDTRLAHAARQLDAGDRLLTVRADAALPADLVRLAETVRERYGKLDGVFANAGVASFQPLEAVTEAEFDRTVGVNLKGVLFTVRHTLPLLDAAGGGSVVLNASWTPHRGLPGAAVYAATKAAVLSLARTLGAELAGRGIRVNSVSPGYIVTEMFHAAIPDPADHEPIRAGVPLGRLGTAQDVAETVAFLLSERAAYITGQDLAIDGGLVPAFPSLTG